METIASNRLCVGSAVASTYTITIAEEQGCQGRQQK